MSALITDKFRVYNAKQFLESFDETSSTDHYFFIGRSSSWATLIEYFNLTGTSPGSNPVTLSTGTQTFSGITVISEVEGAWLVTGIDPGVATSIKFGDSLTWTGGSATVLKVRPSTEDAPLRPQDNLAEKYDYHREIVAAKRIYDSTLGNAAGSSPDGSYVKPVVNRYDFGVNENFSPRVLPYDMWRHNYSSTPNFTRLSDTGEASVSNLEMLVRNPFYEVWLCIDNNGGAIPAAAADGPRTPASGGATAATPDDLGYHAANGVYKDTANYRWKYLYTLTTTDVLRFQSQKFIPLVPFAGVQVVGPEVVSILDPGSGWTNGTYYAPINGDGQSSASAYKVCKFEVSGGLITSARVLTSAESGVSDTNYTFATIDISTTGTGNSVENKYGVFTNATLTTPAGSVGVGSLEVVIPPQGGYGSSDFETFQEQLNTKRVMCNIRLTFAEGSGDFPVTNDFRRIGLLRDPRGFVGDGVGAALAGNVETVRNTYAVYFEGGSGPSVNYIPDETITQTLADGANTLTVKGTVVEWLPVNATNPSQGGFLRYYQNATTHRDNGKLLAFGGEDFGAGTEYGPVVGSISGASATPTSSPAGAGGPSSTVLPGAPDINGDGQAETEADLFPEIEPFTGEILYVENRRLITRAADQIEDIKLVIEF